MKQIRNIWLACLLLTLVAFSVSVAKETEKNSGPVKKKVLPSPVEVERDTASLFEIIGPSQTGALPPAPIAPTAGEEINWWVIAAGGGPGTSTNYMLEGTVGQTAVETGTSTNYEVHHGFWQLFSQAGDCCRGRVGDANGLLGDEPTLGDIMMLVNAKYIAMTCEVLPCMTEADVNQSGGANPVCDDITLVDIMTLVSYLYIVGPSLGLPDCL